MSGRCARAVLDRAGHRLLGASRLATHRADGRRDADQPPEWSAGARSAPGQLADGRFCPAKWCLPRGHARSQRRTAHPQRARRASLRAARHARLHHRRHLGHRPARTHHQLQPAVHQPVGCSRAADEAARRCGRVGVDAASGVRSADLHQAAARAGRIGHARGVRCAHAALRQGARAAHAGAAQPWPADRPCLCVSRREREHRGQPAH